MPWVCGVGVAGVALFVAGADTKAAKNLTSKTPLHSDLTENVHWREAPRRLWRRMGELLGFVPFNIPYQ